MNKFSLLTVACAVLISTVGATATVSATQVGHSPFYYFDVANNGKAVGYVVVNTANPKTPTYTLIAHRLTPNTEYTFGYTASGVVHTLGTAKTTEAGALVTYGTFPAADVKDLQSAQFWVTEPLRSSYTPIGGFMLGNNGLFVARLTCEYSTDGGVTWQRSGYYSSDITMGRMQTVPLLLLAPYNALVRIYVVVVWGRDHSGTEVFQCVKGNGDYAVYSITGTTLNNELHYNGILPAPR